MRVVTGLYLSAQGSKHFAEWFEDNAQPNVDRGAIKVDMLNTMEQRVEAEESRCYELSSQYTQSGRPEIFYALDGDLDIEFGDDQS